MESLLKPEHVAVPISYHKWLLRDILHLNEEDLNKLEIKEYAEAINYAWLTYTVRRVDYSLQKILTKDKSEGITLDFTAINPVSKALNQLKLFSIIPKYNKKGENKKN